MGIYKNLFRLAMAMKVEENVMSGEISSALSVGKVEIKFEANFEEAD